nr:WYL domain-containing protein [Chitinophagales bacterium]
LDRIESISVAYAENYLKTDIEFSEYFDEIYGVTLVDSPVEEIVLHFYEMQGHYIATNPIHPLQKGKWIDEKTYELRLKLRINYELISKLLSYGAQLKVVKPDILVQRMRDTILQMNSLYPLNG